MPRVLVIENHSAIKELIVQWLKQRGIEVVAIAYKISQAPKKLLDEYAPDAVVVRIREHHTLGLPLIRNLIAADASAVVVGLLADYDQKAIQQLKDMGAKGGLVILPMMANQLLQIIATGQPIWAQAQP